MRRPEDLQAVADRAEQAAVYLLTCPTRGATLLDRERDAVTRGRTFLRRLAEHQGASSRLLLARGEEVRRRWGAVGFAMVVEAVARTGSLAPLFADDLGPLTRSWAQIMREEITR